MGRNSSRYFKIQILKIQNNNNNIAKKINKNIINIDSIWIRDNNIFKNI